MRHWIVTVAVGLSTESSTPSVTTHFQTDSLVVAAAAGAENVVVALVGELAVMSVEPDTRVHAYVYGPVPPDALQAIAGVVAAWLLPVMWDTDVADSVANKSPEVGGAGSVPPPEPDPVMSGIYSENCPDAFLARIQ